jgi:hypothetical protein
MTTENITISTWLPVFPGFYGTMFDEEIMYEQEIDYINERILPEELAEAMVDNLYNSKAGSQLWKDYTESIAKQCTKTIEAKLKELGFVEAIKFEEISSPKYYNFSNDSINVEVIFSAENIQAIRHFISEHFAQWKEYLRGKYTSCDGFTSHHANVPGAEEWFVDNALNDGHNAGAVLDFLCGENKIDQEYLYYGCENNVELDTDMLKKECIEKGWYVPDTIWNRVKGFLSARLPEYKKQIDSKGKQYIFDTQKQRYIFAISKEPVYNDNFIVKRFFKIFIFGRLKDGKAKNS